MFAALGVGMALPYLAVAAVPAVASWLPRPGRWMIVLRRLLGFALAGTAVWLLAVLAGVIGPMAATAAGVVMLAIAGFLAAGNRFGGTVKAATGVAAAVLAVGALAIPVTAGSARQTDTDAKEELAGLWQPFDEAAIASLVADGKVVFVDVTADWCVTCQVNKTFVLARDKTMTRLQAPDVVAMQADWTRPSDEIAAYLAKYGRYGIPFNVVYGPGAPEGVILPELLTESAVTDAFTRAFGG